MSSENPAANEADKPRILVVDDSRLMRVAVKKILKKEYDLVEAGDGDEGWEAVSDDDSIQVVISDLNMPNLDGFGLLEKIRNSDDERISQLPVIIITGNEDDDATREKALSAGASDFVTKPFDSVQLRARANAHTRHRQTTRKLSEVSTALEENTNIDPLTHLANRRYFQEKGNECISFSKRHETHLALIRMDIDEFNNFFIKAGRYVADNTLIRIAELLTSTVRQEDTVARLGVAQFGLLLTNSTLEGASQLAHRIRDQISTGILADNETIPAITVSMGISAPVIEADFSFEQLFHAAERQLAQALESGGNSISIDHSAVEEICEQTVPGLDAAVTMAGNERHEQLLPCLPNLMQRLLPLLEIANRHLALGMEEAVERIRQLK